MGPLNGMPEMASAALDARSDVGLHFRVQGQHVDHHLHFVVEAFGEQRADRTVDQTAGQRFEFAGTAFTLEEAARDLARGISLFEVVDGQRKEVLAGLGVGFGDHGGQHAGFHRDLVGAPLEGLGDFVEQTHGVFSFDSVPHMRADGGDAACGAASEPGVKLGLAGCHSNNSAHSKFGGMTQQRHVSSKPINSSQNAKSLYWRVTQTGSSIQTCNYLRKPSFWISAV